MIKDEKAFNQTVRGTQFLIRYALDFKLQMQGAGALFVAGESY